MQTLRYAILRRPCARGAGDSNLWRLQKDVALLSVIGVRDAVRVAQSTRAHVQLFLADRAASCSVAQFPLLG